MNSPSSAARLGPALGAAPPRCFLVGRQVLRGFRRASVTAIRGAAVREAATGGIAAAGGKVCGVLTGAAASEGKVCGVLTGAAVAGDKICGVLTGATVAGDKVWGVLAEGATVAGDEVWGMLRARRRGGIIVRVGNNYE